MGAASGFHSRTSLAQAAAATETCGRNIIVAVIDSGWDRAQPEPRVVPGFDLVDPDDFTRVRQGLDDHDCHGHGTACAQLILQVAPDARVMPVRVFGRRLETTVAHLEMAVRVATEHGASVISMSLATILPEALVPLYRVCETATRRGVLIVAAAYRPRQDGYPAVFENVIGVEAGSVDSSEAFRYREGEAIECVATGASPQPGPLHRGGHTLPSHGYGSNSFATARMAGMLARFRAARPAGDIAEARRWLAAYAFEPEETNDIPTAGGADIGNVD